MYLSIAAAASALSTESQSASLYGAREQQQFGVAHDHQVLAPGYTWAESRVSSLRVQSADPMTRLLHLDIVAFHKDCR